MENVIKPDSIYRAKSHAIYCVVSLGRMTLMINPDELEPQRVSAKPRDLQQMSVGELKDYIVSLEEEIARAEAAIAKKEAHKSGIEALFGAPKE
jgi:uncharacterized small protein (DUF1192 family)